MNTDFSYCSGILPDESYCPLAVECKRFVIPTPCTCWFVKAAFDGKRCPNFINRNDKKMTKPLQSLENWKIHKEKCP